MATTPKKHTFESIIRDIKNHQFQPVYLIMGEESYYIDRITEALEANVLSEEEKAFNLITFYGQDADLNEVIHSARSFPMGANYTLIELREAQHLKNLDLLTTYLQSPQPSTVLLVTYKGKVDQRRKFATLAASTGVLYSSDKLKEEQLPPLIQQFFTQNGCAIDHKSTQMLATAIGNDLNRLYGELNKLLIVCSQGNRNITPEIIERHIGISKQYNLFELQDAIAVKDSARIVSIVKYFDGHQKEFPVQQIFPFLFQFFSRLMIAHYAPNKTSSGIAAHLGSNEWAVRKSIIPAMRNYPAGKVMQILAKIRQFDAFSKGRDGNRTPPGDLLKELFFIILH